MRPKVKAAAKDPEMCNFVKNMVSFIFNIILGWWHGRWCLARIDGRGQILNNDKCHGPPCWGYLKKIFLRFSAFLQN